MASPPAAPFRSWARFWREPEWAQYGWKQSGLGQRRRSGPSGAVPGMTERNSYETSSWRKVNDAAAYRQLAGPGNCLGRIRFNQRAVVNDGVESPGTWVCQDCRRHLACPAQGA